MSVNDYFNEYNSKKNDTVPIQERLKLLFSYWGKAQNSEPEESYRKTCPKDLEGVYKFRESFIPDGCVDYELYEKSEIKLLFILKEPGSNNKNNKEIANADNPWIGHNDDDSFDNHWYKGVINRINDDKERRYRERFEKMASIFRADIMNTAMININKRGGFRNGTNNTKLKNYTKTYRKFIVEQIKILNPDIIISCIGGSAYYELFDDGKWTEVFIDNKKCYGHFGGKIAGLETMKSYDTYHPANTRIKDIEKYGQLLEEIVKNAGC